MDWHIVLAYYGKLLQRAWKETWHFTRAKLLIPLTLTFLGLFLRWWLLGYEEWVKAVWDVLLIGLGSILAVFALSFLWNLSLAPARLAEEQNQRYNDVAQELQGLRQTIATSTPSGLFVVQQTKHELGVREENGGFGWLDPSIKPKTGTLMLRVEVSIDAIPAKLVEYIELTLMGRRIPSDWKSCEVHQVRQRFIYCDIPDWVNPGLHPVQLVARSSDEEVSSPDFVVHIPRTT